MNAAVLSTHDPDFSEAVTTPGCPRGEGFSIGVDCCSRYPISPRCGAATILFASSRRLSALSHGRSKLS